MIDDLIDRRVPLAVAFALLLQAGTAVWWAATKDSDDHFQQQRIDHVEATLDQNQETQAQLMQRLARIEAGLDAQAHQLDRIEKQLAGRR